MKGISAFFSAIRQVLPPTEYLVLAAIGVIFVDGLWFALPALIPGAQDVDAILMIRDKILLLLLTAFGIFRVAWFHPLFRRDYFDWLQRTPWHPGLALPLGPVRLHWPDILIVGGLSLLLADPREMIGNQFVRYSTLTGIVTFLQAHAITLMFAVWMTRPRATAYLAAFLLGLSARTAADSLPFSVVTLILGSVVQHVGLNRSWGLFPWSETTEWVSRLKTGWKSAQSARAGQPLGESLAPDRVPPAELGWPFGVCSPYVPPQIISKPERLLIAALVGFWLHVMLAGQAEEITGGASAILALYGIIGVALTKIATFGGNHAPPINLAGRLFTFRWIVPRYDAAVVGPLSVLIVAGAGATVGHFMLGVPLEYLTPCMLTLTLWTATLAGPSPSKWKLTAPARLTAGRLNKNSFDELS